MKREVDHANQAMVNVHQRAWEVLHSQNYTEQNFRCEKKSDFRLLFFCLFVHFVLFFLLNNLGPCSSVCKTNFSEL